VIPKGQSAFLDGMVVKSARSYNAGLRWSHDSTRFAFMSNGGVGEYSIYVGAVGAKEKAVAADSGTKDGSATWSPATNELAFVSARAGSGDVYVVDLGSKGLTRLTAGGAVNIFPDWFPGGNRLVYASGDALNHDIMVVERPDLKTSWDKPWPLTISHRDNLRPTVSPDGRYVAFYSDDPAPGADERRWNIVVVPFETGHTYGELDLRSMVVARDVVIDLNTGPSWSPDSGKLFFVKRDPSVFNPIHAYDLFSGRSYEFKTKTRMNRDILMSRLGILSFRAQAGVWDRVFVALTNQGLQLQKGERLPAKIHYLM
jgi:Tol biopolymer transport system component